MLDKNLDKVLQDFGKKVVKLAKIRIGRTNKGRRINTTGKLKNSINYKQSKEKNEVDFYFEDYGINVDAGVVGKKKRILKNWDKSIFKRGSGYSTKPPPFTKIRKWIDDKPIKPRNLSSGKFVNFKDTDVKDRMAYAIRKKIFDYGKQPTLFFSDPFNDEYKKLPNDAIKAFANDVALNLKK